MTSVERHKAATPAVPGQAVPRRAGKKCKEAPSEPPVDLGRIRSRLQQLARLPLNVLLAGQEGLIRQQGARFTPDSLRDHPGKMLPHLARTLVAEYSHPGDWILDPMSGIGTTGVAAIEAGRHYVGVELEARFVRHQRRNLAAARRRGASGKARVIRGDARRLSSHFPRKRSHSAAATGSGPFHLILTSPPYADRLRPQFNPSRIMRELLRAKRYPKNILPGTYGDHPANLGNLPPTAHLEGMRQVYQGCWECLQPGELLVIVIQPLCQGPRLRPLHHETVALCRELGFELLDERIAVLGRVGHREQTGAVSRKDTDLELIAHASFWRRLRVAQLREQGFPVSLGQTEYILVFRRPSRAPVRRSRPAPTPTLTQTAVPAATAPR